MKKEYWLVIMCVFYSIVHLGQGKDTVLIKELLDTAYTYEVTFPKVALKLYEESFDISIKENYPIGAFKSAQYTGIVYSNLGNYDSARIYYKKSVIYAIKSGYELGKGTSFINIGNTYQFEGNYSLAIDFYLKGIKVFEAIEEEQRLSTAYQNLGTLLLNTKRLTEAKNYYFKALNLLGDSNILKGIVWCDLSMIAIKEKELDSSLFYLNKAVEVKKINTNSKLDFFVARNYGEYYSEKEEYQLALLYYTEALELNKLYGDVFYEIDLNRIIGYCYLKNNELREALLYLNKAKQKAIAINSTENLIAVLKDLSSYYNKVEPSRAYEIHIEATRLDDSLKSRSVLKQINTLEKQYELEKKNKKILSQELKIEQNELTMMEQNNKLYWLLGIGLFFLLFSIFIWLFYQQKQNLKANEIQLLKQKNKQFQLEALIDGEEKERSRIAQDLHDGVNGDLSAIKYQISSIEAEQLLPKTVKDLQKAIEMIDNSCEQIRNVSHNLSPHSIRNFGLISTVGQFCLKMSSAHKVNIHFHCYGNIVKFSHHVETIIYRIIQELIYNIVKHAQAEEGVVQINYQDKKLMITVEDDGIGFNSKQLVEGIGLKNITSRIEYLNAELDISSNKEGSTFLVIIPINKLLTL